MYRFKFHCRVKTNISKPSYTSFIFTDLVYYSLFVRSISAFASLLPAGIAGYSKKYSKRKVYKPYQFTTQIQKIRLKIAACGP